MTTTTNTITPIHCLNYYASLHWDYTAQLQAVANQVAYSLLNRLDWLSDKQQLISQWRRDIHDGCSDLVNEAIVSILEQIRAQQARDEGRWIDLERVYTVHALKSRVLIRDNSVAYIDRETTPMQEVYRHCRRWIESQRQHISIDDINANWVDDSVDGMSLERRVGRACDLYGRTVRLADSIGVFAESMDDYHDSQQLIESLGLTKKQAEVLAYLLQGYRAKAIASAKGLNLQAVQDSIAQIQKKALKVFEDFEPKQTVQKSLNIEQEALIAQMLKNNKSYREIRSKVGCSSYIITKIKRKLGL